MMNPERIITGLCTSLQWSILRILFSFSTLLKFLKIVNHSSNVLSHNYHIISQNYGTVHKHSKLVQ